MSALVKIQAEDLIKRQAKPASLLDQKSKQQKITIKTSEAMPSPLSEQKVKVYVFSADLGVHHIGDRKSCLTLPAHGTTVYISRSFD